MKKEISLMAAAALVASVAYAATPYKLGSNRIQITEVAGKKGNGMWRIGPAGDFRALFQITGREKRDDAWFAVKSRHLNTLRTELHAPAKFADQTNSPKTIGFDDTETYIRGIAVCLNRGKDEVKGIKIWGARLDRNSGNLTNIASPKKWERTNCKYWGEAKYCTEGRVATVVQVHHTLSSAGYYTGTQGLALECRTIRPR